VPVIETAQLGKQYGSVRALGGVSLRVEPGEIYGLLGQNGAGKTTLIKILLGITRSTGGTARLLDQPVGTAAVRSRIGYLPEDHRFPDYHTGASLLDFYGSLAGMPRKERRLRAAEVLDQVGLQGRKNYKIRTYSKGMKQRLGIAQAILHEPEVIFLDEPTDGVDPVGRREIRTLLQNLKAKGTTLFINSHLLSEVELICDRVAILQKGVMIREGKVTELTELRGVFVVGLQAGQAMPVDEIRKAGFQISPSGNVEAVAELWEVVLEPNQNIDALIDLLRNRGLSLRHLVEKRQTLEELFMMTVTEAEPGIDTRQANRAVPNNVRAPR
jgi:ABC-2 type transport system ATP-binding protein